MSAVLGLLRLTNTVLPATACYCCMHSGYHMDLPDLTNTVATACYCCMHSGYHVDLLDKVADPEVSEGWQQ